MRMDEEKYNNWYNEFSNYIKEGVNTDTENSQQLVKLLRYKSTISGEFINLDDYVKKMKPEQKKIYFLVQPELNLARNSPFMEPFKSADAPPVLFLENHVDEVSFRTVNEYKGFKFVNIETNFEEISKDVSHRVEVSKEFGLPESDTTSFCLWIKSELEPHISRVSISKRLT